MKCPQCTGYVKIVVYPKVTYYACMKCNWTKVEIANDKEKVTESTTKH